MNLVYRMVRLSLIVVTIVPLLFLLAINSDWEDFIEDIWE